jgi:tetratricopeptide (TPR) repeat protein
MIEPCNPTASLDPSINQQFQRALALYHQGQRAEAQSRLRRVTAADPCHRESLHLLAIIAAQDRKLAVALELFERALSVDPNNAALHADKGLVLRQLRRWDDALGSYDRALALDPGLAQAHLNRGAVLKELERWREALASYDRMLAIHPGHGEAHYNRANLLQQLGRFDAALAGYERAIAYNPNNAAAHANRGGVLRQLGRWDEAEASYTRAIAIDPGDAGAYFNRAIVRLTKGDFYSGLTEYEWRFRDPNCPSFTELRNFPQPRWTGAKPASGRSIFLHCEQGFGDVIQFCRYASLLKDLGVETILEVPRPLLGLLASLQGISRLVPRGAPPPAFDYHSPLLSLPLALNATLEKIPSPGKYLSCNASKVEQWRRRLGERSMPRVGLVWSGNASFINEDRRRIPLEKLIRHLPQGLEYFRLQKDLRDSDRKVLNANPQLRDFTSELADFEDTAALCECMDLVISTCTSVAHLSSALGKRTWILLAHIADWRWFLDRDDSPWYASARLYRQASNGDWDGVLRRVAIDLEKIRS